MSASSTMQLLVQGAMLRLPRACLTMKQMAAISPMHIAVQEQLQTQLEETLQLTAQLRAQRQGLASVSAAPQAKVEAKKIVTLGELTDDCEL